MLFLKDEKITQNVMRGKDINQSIADAIPFYISEAHKIKST
jgi:hypothetical protein